MRFTCAYDGNGCEILKDILARYEKQHPDVKIVTDVVPYKALLEGLPVQLAGGSGPDFATVTDLGGLNRYYLDLTPYVDAKYWEDNFSNVLKWYRSGPDDKGIYGMHTQLTITGAFINRTLFDQANVAVHGKDATLDDWAKAANAVAKATGTPYPMAIDRSGHRIAGPAISYGAKIFDADGKPILVDEGFTTFVKKFVEWNKDGTMARDVWAGQGGNTYRDAAQEFINGQLVYYYSGSWQTARFDSRRRCFRLGSRAAALRRRCLHRHAGRYRRCRLQADQEPEDRCRHPELPRSGRELSRLHRAHPQRSGPQGRG